jgi:hypothetical protein
MSVFIASHEHEPDYSTAMIISKLSFQFIFLCEPRPGQYKKSSPETLMPPSSSDSLFLLLGTGLSGHCLLDDKV